MEAKVFKQLDPTPIGTEVINGERVTIYAANLVPVGIIEGVTRRDLWLKAHAIATNPVLDWLK